MTDGNDDDDECVVNVYSESLAAQEKENLYPKSLSRKLNNFNCVPGKSSSSAAVPGISIAMDSRLENGIEMCAELRLRVSSCLSRTLHLNKKHLYAFL